MFKKAIPPPSGDHVELLAWRAMFNNKTATEAYATIKADAAELQAWRKAFPGLAPEEAGVVERRSELELLSVLTSNIYKKFHNSHNMREGCSQAAMHAACIISECRQLGSK